MGAVREEEWGQLKGRVGAIREEAVTIIRALSGNTHALLLISFQFVVTNNASRDSVSPNYFICFNHSIHLITWRLLLQPSIVPSIVYFSNLSFSPHNVAKQDTFSCHQYFQ